MEKNVATQVECRFQGGVEGIQRGTAMCEDAV